MEIIKNLTNKKIVYILIFIGFVLYLNSFGNQMFWDDNDSILNNTYIQNWEHLPKYFSENLIAGAGIMSDYWRPTLLLVFSFEWHLWGDWAPGYHFINTSFHITNAIFLFFILFYLFKEKWLALFTSLIFLIHPLQTEAVTYVAGLGDSLSIFFIFLGILFYLKATENRSLYKWSLVMYGLALMSKETAIVMPGFLFIIDFVVLRKKFKEIIKSIWPFFAMAGFYILLRSTVLNFSNTFNLYNEENLFTSSILVRILTFFKILTIYFQLLFWPVGLHMERSVEIAVSFFSPLVIIGALIFSGLIIISIVQFKKRPIIAFGILWFFVGLVLISNIFIPINGLLYEHWLYVLMIGIFLPIIWLLFKKEFKFTKYIIIVFTIFSIFLSFLTMSRNREWRNPIVFYNQTLEHAPNSYKVINNLGMAYNNNKDYKKAEETYLKAIAVDPLIPNAYHNLANNYKNINEIKLAIENYKKAIKLSPNFIYSYNALIGLYLKNEQYNEAINLLKHYSEIVDPQDQGAKQLITEIQEIIDSKK